MFSLVNCQVNRNGLMFARGFVFDSSAKAAAAIIKINSNPKGFETLTGERLTKATLGTLSQAQEWELSRGYRKAA